MTTKAELHRLVDLLPDADVEAAGALLANPRMLSLLTGPEDEPPLSREEYQGIARARREFAEGEVKTVETVDDLLADVLEGDDDN